MDHAEMPERTREHVLETAPTRRFQITLPDEWTAGAPLPDYGVDLLVEIFEPAEAGGYRATGLLFGVQLKSTDSEEADSLRVGVKWSTVSYWNALPIPVLLVRYLAADDTLLATWVHDHYRYFVVDERQKAWFKFDPQRHSLSRSNVAKLSDDVRRFIELRNRRLPWPLVVSIYDETGQPLLIRDLLERCAALQAGMTKHVEFRVGRSAPPAPAITIATDHITFDLGAGHGATMLTAGEGRRSLGSSSSGADLLAIIASALANLGVDEVATELLSRVASTTEVLNGTLPLGLGLAAIRVGRRDLVLDVISRAATPSPDVALVLANALVPPAPFVQRPEDVAAVERALREAIAAAEEGERPFLWRGLARWLARVHQTGRACEAYAEAARLDSNIELDSQFWYERGSALVDHGDLEGGTAAYRRALDLGEDGDLCRALYADALLLGGDVAEARKEFDVAAEGEQPFTRMGSFLAEVLETVAGAHFDRDPEAARSIALDARKAIESGTMPSLELAASIITADPLDPLGWHLCAMNLTRDQAMSMHVLSAWLGPRTPSTGRARP